MSRNAAIPSRSFVLDDFVKTCRDAPDHLIYFLVNVGDADMQLILLPADIHGDHIGSRRAIIVDIGLTGKMPALIESLAEADIFQERDDLFPILVATHPHSDHIRGMAEFIDRFGSLVSEFWDPGYYHPSGAYVEMMRALEEQPGIQYTQPTSGMARFINRVRILTLCPGIGLRSRFDSYGTTINDSSIALKIEYPIGRIVQVDQNRRYTRRRHPWSFILGADSQTTSWAQATVDFPELHRQENSVLHRELGMARGADPLKSQVFKIPHHGSKHGLNLELVERISPLLSLISSTMGGGKYNFPHLLAVEAIREAKQPSTTEHAERRPDHELGIYCTGDLDDEGRPLGTVAIAVPPKVGGSLRMWRFGDTEDEEVDLKSGRLAIA